MPSCLEVTTIQHRRNTARKLRMNPFLESQNEFYWDMLHKADAQIDVIYYDDTIPMFASSIRVSCCLSLGWHAANHEASCPHEYCFPLCWALLLCFFISLSIFSPQHCTSLNNVGRYLSNNRIHAFLLPFFI